jgi:hypothetical protein
MDQHVKPEEVLRRKKENRRRQDEGQQLVSGEEERWRRPRSRERPRRRPEEEEGCAVVPVPATACSPIPRPSSCPRSQSPFPYNVREPTTKIGGGLAEFYLEWRKITANKTVLSYIKGAKILFTSQPSPRLSSFAQPRFSSEEASQVDQFVDHLEKAQVISVVSKKSHQIVSPIFLTTNHDGSLRLIFNMKKINKE